jgi:hypothetical protein
MALWVQHLLVLTVVFACAGYAVWGAVSSLVGKKSRIGSCCAKGCAAQLQQAKPEAAGRVVFLPVELLGKSRRK